MYLVNKFFEFLVMSVRSISAIYNRKNVNINKIEKIVTVASRSSCILLAFARVQGLGLFSFKALSRLSSWQQDQVFLSNRAKKRFDF